LDDEATDRYVELNGHLKHAAREPSYVKLPSKYGELILDVDSIDRSYDQIDGMSEDQKHEAETRWAAAKALFRPGAHAASEQAMKAVTARYPYWGKGHGALYDLNLHLRRLGEAEYHLKQLVAIQPTYANVFKLAELYVQKDEKDAAFALVTHLFETRRKAPDRVSAINVATLYLIILMDKRDAPGLYAVADQAARDYGPEAVFEYHAVLGLFLQKKREAARARMKSRFPTLAPRHPMFAKVQRLKLLLNGPPQGL
jgi:hypothetical protein